jgi:hypothetical protein
MPENISTNEEFSTANICDFALDMETTDLPEMSKTKTPHKQWKQCSSQPKIKAQTLFSIPYLCLMLFLTVPSPCMAYDNGISKHITYKPFL